MLFRGGVGRSLRRRLRSFWGDLNRLFRRLGARARTERAADDDVLARLGIDVEGTGSGPLVGEPRGSPFARRFLALGRDVDALGQPKRNPNGSVGDRDVDFDRQFREISVDDSPRGHALNRVRSGVGLFSLGIDRARDVVQGPVRQGNPPRPVFVEQPKRRLLVAIRRLGAQLRQIGLRERGRDRQ